MLLLEHKGNQVHVHACVRACIVARMGQQVPSPLPVTIPRVCVSLAPAGHSIGLFLNHVITSLLRNG